MWFKKSKVLPRIEGVVCEECKHLVDKKSAHQVIAMDRYDCENKKWGTALYYCTQHPVEYDLITIRDIYDKKGNYTGKRLVYSKLIPAVEEHYEEINLKK